MTSTHAKAIALLHELAREIKQAPAIKVAKK